MEINRVTPRAYIENRIVRDRSELKGFAPIEIVERLSNGLTDGILALKGVVFIRL